MKDITSKRRVRGMDISHSLSKIRQECCNKWTLQMTPGISWANFYEPFFDLLHSDLSIRACDPLLHLSHTSPPAPAFTICT